MIIDAHVHLWDVQQGRVDGRPVCALDGGRSDFGGEIRQMMPPYMVDGRNPWEMLLSNMDYAGVSGCVVTQEEIDGNQDAYLLEAKAAAQGRLKICSLYEEGKPYLLGGFDGIKVCAGRLQNPDLTALLGVCKAAEGAGLFLSIDLAEGDVQTASLQEIAQACPDLRIAIGHFGMVNRPGWLEQIKLARLPNVFIESGGITWLFHGEYYPYPSAVRAIREAADAVGMDKLMWGSDYPRTMTVITYGMSLDFVQKSPELTETEKIAFLGGNAARFYGFPALPIPPHIPNMVEE